MLNNTRNYFGTLSSVSDWIRMETLSVHFFIDVFCLPCIIKAKQRENSFGILRTQFYHVNDIHYVKQIQCFVIYLTNWRHCLIIHYWASGKLPMLYGIPQGSIIIYSSSLVVLVYIDIHCRLPWSFGRVFASADNTTLTLKFSVTFDWVWVQS